MPEFSGPPRLCRTGTSSERGHVVDQRKAYQRFQASTPFACSLCGFPLPTIASTLCAKCGASLGPPVLAGGDR